MVVERALAAENISRRELGREKFVERVWEWKKNYGGRINRGLRALGSSCDWTRERFTLDAGLSRAVRAVQADGRTLYVPGHGPLAGPNDLVRYLAVIDGLEETARSARRAGWTAEEAGERHQVPENLGEWTLFNPAYFQRAVEAWMKEWDERG